MPNYRDQYWRWLILGLGGLTRMIVQQADEAAPSPEIAAALAHQARTLTDVATRFQATPSKDTDHGEPSQDAAGPPGH